MTATEAAPKEIEILTASRMRSFRDCARKHQLAYVEGWRPVVQAEALRFGSLLHRGLEEYWKAVRDGGSFSEAFEAVQRNAADPYEGARATEMLVAYYNTWAESDVRDYEVLAVEQRFDAPLLNPETMAPSRTWRLSGKVDAIVRRREDGRVLVVEHKTTSDNVAADDADYWTKLHMDPQISMYMLGAEALGYEVDEVLYDVLGKPTQRPLKATAPESRKYTKDGKLYAAQRDRDETPSEHQARVAAAIAENPGRFTARRLIPRMESQVRDFMADAWAQAATMRESARLGRAPRNPDACDSFGRCPYWILCASGGRPEDYSDFHRVTNKHPELEEERQSA